MYSVLFSPTKRIERQNITSPDAESTDKYSRVLSSGIPVASAISVSSFSPEVFRYWRISCIGFRITHHDDLFIRLEPEFSVSPFFVSSDQQNQPIFYTHFSHGFPCKSRMCIG